MNDLFSLQRIFNDLIYEIDHVEPPILGNSSVNRDKKPFYFKT